MSRWCRRLETHDDMSHDTSDFIVKNQPAYIVLYRYVRSTREFLWLIMCGTTVYSNEECAITWLSDRNGSRHLLLLLLFTILRSLETHCRPRRRSNPVFLKPNMLPIRKKIFSMRKGPFEDLCHRKKGEKDLRAAFKTIVPRPWRLFSLFPTCVYPLMFYYV